MEHLWSQADATGGNQRQFVWTPETQTSCKQLHPAASTCREEPMVRRGSTVRVRQRALEMLSPAVTEASLLRSVLADITGYQRGDLTLGLRELRDILSVR